jgi:outer membrane protein TolC
MPKDKKERREKIKARVRTRAKTRVASNGTVQRLRQARAEIKQLKAELETLRGHEPQEVEMPASEHPAGHPPVAEAAPE